MDIIAALHWVHDNVAEMGGDSSNITLVGHSSGASLANLLMISPMARGMIIRFFQSWFNHFYDFKAGFIEHHHASFSDRIYAG